MGGRQATITISHTHILFKVTQCEHFGEHGTSPSSPKPTFQKINIASGEHRPRFSSGFIFIMNVS